MDHGDLPLYRTDESVDPLGALPASRHPFQVWAMFACMFGGLGLLLNLGDSPTLNDLLPRIATYVWAFLVFFCGLAAIVGAFVKDRASGLLLERAALVSLALATPLYAIGVFYYARGDGILPGCYALSIGIASAWRVRHINGDIKRLSAFAKRVM